MPARQQIEDLARFDRAVAALRDARPRPEILLAEVPAPARLAPHTFALRAEVTGVDQAELASGRLVLLHDPRGQEAWAGDFRLVGFVRAELEPDIIADPMLSGVGWDWLIEALAGRSAAHRAASGTITRVVSESFGEMAGRPDACEVELRASWTPTDEDFTAHAEAWCDLLAVTAGLPPSDPDVLVLARARTTHSSARHR